MIVTIDGPAGSGKSTAARKLAARLEIPYLDTGAMYRAITWAAMRRQIDFDDAPELLAMARSVRLDLDCGPTFTRVCIDGHDVSEVIRSMAVSRFTPCVARNKDIRLLLVERQRHIGKELGSFVSEGRDQGSEVFPHADAKFVLEAALAKRAQRRFQEMLADGEEVTIEAVLENVRERDRVDVRQWKPLLESGQAIVLDTTDLTIGEVVDRMQATIEHIK